MKKINLNEEFSAAGRVWMFDDSSGKVIFKNLRPAGKSKPSFIPPTLDEVKAFFKEKGYTEESAIKFHEYYEAGNWKDGKGNQVKNWRQKSMSVWFTDKNKIKAKTEEKDKKGFLF